MNKPVFDPDFQKRKVGIHFNKCDFVAARVDSLKRHVENKHEVIMISFRGGIPRNTVVHNIIIFRSL